MEGREGGEHEIESGCTIIGNKNEMPDIGKVTLF